MFNTIKNQSIQSSGLPAELCLREHAMGGGRASKGQERLRMSGTRKPSAAHAFYRSYDEPALGGDAGWP
jgi:hypothetical protein